MLKSLRSELIAAGAALTVALVAPHAGAQSTADKAAAEALFQAGRDLMNAGKFAEACGKLEASQRLDAGLGTSLYLADCYEKAGRLASAWATFREAESIAMGRDDRARAQVAKGRAVALEPRLSKLSIMVADGNDPATVVKRDGELVPRESWGLALPTDTGEHTIEASAPTRKPWSAVATVQGEGATVPFQVPVLEAAEAEATMPAPVPAPAPSSTATDVPADRSTTSGDSQRAIGLVVGGVGVIGLGVGGYFGFHAKSQNDDSNALCRTDNHNLCSQPGVDLRNDARSSANLATAFMIGGGLVLATGVVLYLTAPTQRTPSAAVSRLRMTAAAGPSESRVLLQGDF